MSAEHTEYVLYLLDRARSACRRHGYSESTESAYLFWIREFVEYCGARCPQDLELGDADEFLRRLEGLATSSQKQARTAIRFLYDVVLEDALDDRPSPTSWIEEVDIEPEEERDRHAASPEPLSLGLDGAVSMPLRGPRHGRIRAVST